MTAFLQARSLTEQLPKKHFKVQQKQRHLMREKAGGVLWDDLFKGGVIDKEGRVQPAGLPRGKYFH